MKPLILMLIFLFGLSVVSTAQSRAKEEVLELTRQLLEASQKADSNKLKELLADDYILTYSDGKAGSYSKYINKQQAVKKWGTPNPDIQSTVSVSNQRVELFNSTAVVFSRITDKWKEKTTNKEHIAKTWVSDIWIRIGKKWQLCSSHETILSEQ